MDNIKPPTKIFCFIQSGKDTDWVSTIAICEDGHCLAEHLSSDNCLALQDIGMTSDMKHDRYKEHCPDGYDLVWLDDPANSPELDAAYAKNQELAAKAVLEEANK